MICPVFLLKKPSPLPAFLVAYLCFVFFVCLGGGFFHHFKQNTGIRLTHTTWGALREADGASAVSSSLAG